MKRLISGSLTVIAVLWVAGCAADRPAATAGARTGVLPADARALKYGATAPAVFANPAMHDKILALFGNDWSPTPVSGGQLQYGAAAYFPPTSSFRMVRLDGGDYIAITGCVPVACADHAGLLLIRDDGEQLWARVDEGGFSRYYGHGPAMTGAQVSPAFIDSAWREVERLGRG
jgi:hypothetical protein